MSRLKVVLPFVAASLFIAGGWAAQRRARSLDARLAAERARWETDRAELEAALALASVRPLPVIVSAPVGPLPLSPRAIIERLRALPQGDSPRVLQLAVHWLEELSGHGAGALPAIRDALATGQDRDLDAGWIERGRGWRERLPGDFVAPPSLRLGLLDVVRRVGGPEAEDLLAVSLSTSGRGVELAWLTRVLHESAPNRHREAALAAAHQLLAAGATPPGGSLLDRHHRDHLFAVLAFYGDVSYAATAQRDLVKPEGVDGAALSYLRRTLGARSVDFAIQAYQDPRLADPGRRVPLARLALEYVGSDPAATDLWQKAIADLAMPRGARKDLIEDLNDKGFPDPDHPTARDLPLIETRLALIEKLAPGTTDPVNAAAFAEAYRDLQDMRRRAQGTPH
jgi:hypothetical protein